ncbi:hypothetical protein, partial [Azospirillum rugosum]
SDSSRLQRHQPSEGTMNSVGVVTMIRDADYITRCMSLAEDRACELNLKLEDMAELDRKVPLLARVFREDVANELRATQARISRYQSMLS